MGALREIALAGWVAEEARLNWRWLGLGVLAAAGIAACDVAGVHLVKLLVDLALSWDSEQVVPILGLLAGLLTASAALHWTRSYASGVLSSLSGSRVRHRTVGHITGMSLSDVGRHHSADVISRVHDDGSQIASFMGRLPDYAHRTLLIVFSLVYLLTVDWRLALLALGTVASTVLFSLVATRPISSHSMEYQSRTAEATALLKDTVTGIDVVKACNMEEDLLRRQEETLGRSLAVGIKMARRFSMGVCAGTLSQAVPMLVCVAYGAVLATRGALAPSHLVALLQLLIRLIGPARELPRMVFEARRVDGLVRRAQEILDCSEEHGGTRRTGTADCPDAFELRDVSFSYGREAVLQHVDLSIEKGSRIAIVGRSGCGKSTLLSLVPMLLPGYEGDVRVLGMDAREWDLDVLRLQFAVVPQEPHLFAGSAMQNIRLGRPGATDEEVIDAARAAAAHEFIDQMPGGYHRQLGDRGIALSQGERQRICVARALLRDAPILLLDEPTTALDEKTESTVLASLWGQPRGHTVVMVSHRPSAIAAADEIMVMDRGRLAEVGTHSELLARSSLYADLYAEEKRGRHVG